MLVSRRQAALRIERDGRDASNSAADGRAPKASETITRRERLLAQQRGRERSHTAESRSGASIPAAPLFHARNAITTVLHIC